MTLVRFGASAPPAWSSTTASQEQQLPHGSASIPRSALGGPESTDRGHGGSAKLRKSCSLHNLNIDLSLDAQSSLSVDSKQSQSISQLRFRSFVASNTLLVSREISPSLSGDSICWPSSLEIPAARDLLDTSLQTCTKRPTLDHTDEDSHSPRKPIPSQWLPKASAPRLATAQRARARETKKDSPSGSPVDHETPYSARNFHATDGVTFLTKEALAAIESDITSPTSRHSPTKQQQSRPKPSWNSPVQMPKRELLRKVASSSVKLSPAKIALFSPTIGEHKESTRSVATRGSPVRSPASLYSGCTSAQEVETNLSKSDEIADIVVLQTNKDHVGSKAQASKAMTSPSTKSPKPELFVNIPGTPSHSDPDPRSASTLASNTSSSAASTGLGSPTSPYQTSRIPRPFTGGNTTDARGPTLSSSLKRTKSLVSLGSPKAVPHPERSPIVGKSSLRKADRSTPRHVRTMDSSGATPVITDRLIQSRHSSPCSPSSSSEITLADAPFVEQSLQSRDTATRHQEDEAINASSKDASAYDKDFQSRVSSRKTSASTVKGTPSKTTPLWDPATVDSAVLYSRKKSELPSTIPKQCIRVFSLVMRQLTDFEKILTTMAPLRTSTTRKKRQQKIHQFEAGARSTFP
jgi:hypothetical protein